MKLALPASTRFSPAAIVKRRAGPDSMRSTCTTPVASDSAVSVAVKRSTFSEVDGPMMASLPSSSRSRT